MAIPSDLVLLAAVRWLEHLPRSTLERTRALFSAHPDYADVTPTQYAAALDWLHHRGLLPQTPGHGAARSAVFNAAVTDNLWFRDFDTLVNAPDDVPDDGIRAGELLGLSPADTYAQARHLFGQVDAEARKLFGSAGETALVRLLNTVPGSVVNHLAAESDGYGYDVQVTIATSEAHLEVKSTNRRRRLAIYLSRHEFETMGRDPHWALAAVLLDSNLNIDAVATVARDWLAAAVPGDRTMYGRWESVKLDIPGSAIEPGLAVVDNLDLKGDIAVLGGNPPWML